MDLKNLFNIGNNPKCTGCSILTKNLPQHSIMDYEDKNPVDILFVSDSLKMWQGDYVPFRGNEYKCILTELDKLELGENKIGFTASVKCPNLKLDDINAKDRKICRQHLDDTIKQYKPKLVFACGKLATTMIYGKNIEDKKSRGKVVDFEVGGIKFKLVSIFHPWQVVSEPKNQFLFSHDIAEAINEHILCRKKNSLFKFVPIFTIEELNQYNDKFCNTDKPISIDIETTGLNFLTDTIHTIALSILADDGVTPELTISFPIDHKEFVHPEFRVRVIKLVKDVCRNKKNRKIGQNLGSFDLKFLRREGITEFHDIWDSKLMQGIYQEEWPKKLSDLVYYYFPNEL